MVSQQCCTAKKCLRAAAQSPNLCIAARRLCRVVCFLGRFLPKLGGAAKRRHLFFRAAASRFPWFLSNAALQKSACVRLPNLLICASQQGGSAALSAFLDVSSLNLAAL